MSRALDEALDRIAHACANFERPTVSSTPTAAPVITDSVDRSLPPSQPFSPAPRPVEQYRSSLTPVPAAPSNGADQSRADESRPFPAPSVMANLRDPPSVDRESSAPAASNQGPLGKVFAWVRSWFGTE